MLLEKGASGICNPFTGISPLYAACVNQNVNVVKPLLKKFPALAKQGTKVENNSSLHIVCGNGNIEITKLMLQTDDGLVANIVQRSNLSFQVNPSLYEQTWSCMSKPSYQMTITCIYI